MDADGRFETGPRPGPVSPRVERGRIALSRGAWEDARAAFEEDVEAEPSAEAWEGLATAAAWQQDAACAIEAREEAHRLYRARDDVPGAARTAIWLANDYADFRGDGAVANGWLARARRLLEGHGPCPELGWLHALEAHVALMEGNDPAAARLRAEQGRLAARAAGDPESEALSLAIDGLAQVTEGHVADGMTCLDEAVVAATTGEFSSHNAIAITSCYMIHACERVRDFQRAGEWCRRLREFSLRWNVGFYLTICRLQYSTVLLWRGDWVAAEAELDAAVRDLSEARPAAVAAAYVRLGELRRRQGRWDEAAELFERNRGHRFSQLGRAAMALDIGDSAQALDILEPMLQRIPGDSRTERAAALELLVCARTVRGDLPSARDALDELYAMAGLVGTEPLRAGALFAAGQMASAESDTIRARSYFEEAAELFERAGLPFEAGRARIELSRVLVGVESVAAAIYEATLARNLLEAIGAEREAGRAIEILESLAETTDPNSPNTKGQLSGNSGPLTKRQRQVLELVAEGLSDREIGEKLFLSEHTVHRHLSNILSRLEVASRSAAVAHALRAGWL